MVATVVSWGCYNKMPQTGSLKNSHLLLSQFWMLGNPSSRCCKFGSDESSVPGLQTAAFSCTHMAFLPCTHMDREISLSSSSYRSINPITRAHTLMTKSDPNYASPTKYHHIPHSRLGLHYMNLGEGHKHPVHNNCTTL